MAWTDFLAAASTIYSKLEQGSKSHPSSLGWFGRMKRERKVDPLLSYIHHARNSDEHGIAEITADTGCKFEIKHPTMPLRFEVFAETEEAKDQEFSIFVQGQETITVKPTNAEKMIVLVEVKDDRYNDTFPVPASHLGVKIPRAIPSDAAKNALSYLENLIAAAQNLTLKAQQAK